ncbi:MAG: thioesterase family protein [Nocardioidaceae bacterium]
MPEADLTPGRQGHAVHVVEAHDTAAALGSGDLAVLGTPRLVAWLEEATCDAVAEAVGPTQTTVGTRVAVEHLKASPVGAQISLTATIRHVDGRLVRFEVVAEDADGVLVGHGEITRVRVDRERFLARLSGPSTG